MKRKVYAWYSKDNQKIGLFTETYSADGLKLDLEVHNPVLAMAAVPLKNGSLPEWFDVSEWIEERVIPSTRVGIKDNLKALGLSEWDPLAISHKINGHSTLDTTWIDFDNEV